MKTVSKDGRTWFEKREDGRTYVGFTKQFLETLEECWHIVPAGSRATMIKEGAPLCAVETNEGLFSIPSPVSGIINVFNNAAMNFPDKIKEDLEVAQMVDKAPEETKKTLQQVALDLNIDWDAIEQQQRVRVAPPQDFFAAGLGQDPQPVEAQPAPVRRAQPRFR